MAHLCSEDGQDKHSGGMHVLPQRALCEPVNYAFILQKQACVGCDPSHTAGSRAVCQGLMYLAPESVFLHMDVDRDGFLNLGSVAIWS